LLFLACSVWGQALRDAINPRNTARRAGLMPRGKRLAKAMGESRDPSGKKTRRPSGRWPRARFSLWRPTAIAGVELQIGTQIEAYALPVHFHDSYQFDVMLEGERSWERRQGRCGVGARRLSVAHPGEAHAVNVVGKANSFRTMHVDAGRLLEIHEKIRGRRQLPWFAFDISDAPTVKRFLHAHRMMECEEGSAAESALTAFLDYLVRHHASGEGWRGGAAARAQLRRARDFIDRNLSQEIALEALVKMAGISKFHLVRQFAFAYGLPPHTYQLRARIARARKLLAKGAAVKLVSAELGFAHQRHFGRYFRKVTALTPAEYQRCVTGRISADIVVGQA
jgi:AraC-like DNA-binding protein